MSFASPWWLLLLVPFAGVALWLLWGRRRLAGVPFLSLWQNDQPVQRTRRWIEMPLLALAMALLAITLAILASGGPFIPTDRAGGDKRVTLIIDRGITMSPSARWQNTLEQTKAAMDLLGPGPLDFVPVPDGHVERIDRSGWLERARRDPPEQIDTHDAVALAVRQAMARTSGLIIVMSDHPVAPDRRVIAIAPKGAFHDVGITRVCARQSPRSQVMVSIQNQSPLTVATLIVAGSGSPTRQSIDLPPAGQSRNYFVDVPHIGKSVTASIDVQDDLPSNNRATVTLHALWPAVEVRDPVGPAVRRIIDAYTRARPPGTGSAHIAIVSAHDEAPSTEPGVIIADTSASSPAPVTSAVVTPSAITADVDWNGIKSAAVAPAGPDGFEPILRLNGQPAVAWRQSPARGVWIGFDSPGFEKTTDFAVFWAHLLDWTGQTGSATTASIDLPAVVIDPAKPADWRQKLTEIQPQMERQLHLAPWLLLGSMLCLLLAALSWPRRRLTRFSPLRTV